MQNPSVTLSEVRNACVILNECEGSSKGIDCKYGANIPSPSRAGFKRQPATPGLEMQFLRDFIAVEK